MITHYGKEKGTPRTLGVVSDTKNDNSTDDTGNNKTELTIRNFTDWCSSVLAMPSSSTAIITNPERPLFITSVREPVSRFLSWYFYYIEPELNYNFEIKTEDVKNGDDTTKGNTNSNAGRGLHTPSSVVAERLHEWIKNHVNDTITVDTALNHQSREFLLWSEGHVDEFITLHSESSLASNFHPAGENVPILDFVLVADRFDESLIVLRHLMNWDLKDIAYLKLWNSDGKSNIGQEKESIFIKPLLRWDGLPVKNSLKKNKVGFLTSDILHHMS